MQANVLHKSTNREGLSCCSSSIQLPHIVPVIVMRDNFSPKPLGGGGTCHTLLHRNHRFAWNSKGNVQPLETYLFYRSTCARIARPCAILPLLLLLLLLNVCFCRLCRLFELPTSSRCHSTGIRTLHFARFANNDHHCHPRRRRDPIFASYREGLRILVAAPLRDPFLIHMVYSLHFRNHIISHEGHTHGTPGTAHAHGYYLAQKTHIKINSRAHECARTLTSSKAL